MSCVTFDHPVSGIDSEVVLYLQTGVVIGHGCTPYGSKISLICFLSIAEASVTGEAAAEPTDAHGREQNEETQDDRPPHTYTGSPDAVVAHGEQVVVKEELVTETAGLQQGDFQAVEPSERLPSGQKQDITQGT